MSSLKEVRSQLFIAHDQGIIDDEELLLLIDLNTSDNLDLPYNIYPKFNFDELQNDECVSDFRFTKHDITLLADVLNVPDVVECYQRSLCDGLEALCILLKRFAYPCRYSDMVSRFARPVPVLCMITNHMIDFIYDNWGNKLLQWNNDILSPQMLQTYCDAISAKGSPLDNCFGFIDGTVRPICRPNQSQRIVYNGHKRVHALKFQSLALPNGIIGNLFGPVEGRMHDAGMLHVSNLLQDLQQHAHSPGPMAPRPLCIYGDPAYPLRVHLQAPFRNRVLTPQMQLFNKSMSSLRVSVEWLFGDIANYFKFIDFKKNLKIGLSSVGKMYIVCALLRNALTCLYRNSTSDFFDLDPPNIENYFA